MLFLVGQPTQRKHLVEKVSGIIQTVRAVCKKEIVGNFSRGTGELQVYLQLPHISAVKDKHLEGVPGNLLWSLGTMGLP